MSFFDELRRRNVLRVGAAYAVTAWLIIQVAETIFPLYGLGDTSARIVVTVLAIGLLPTLVFAWVFELTPDGLKKESEVDRSRSITVRTGRTLDRAIMAILALALAYFAFDKFVLDPSEDVEIAEQARQEGRTEALVESYGDQSIAVLAFDDMSPEGDQEYLSDGISEELLNLLAKIPELRVISRSSAFSFKGKDVPIPSIAEQLNVAHVLEGSVRKAGNRIRITAQLIEARSDTHLWSETYDRELDDIFAIQDEIAAAMVEQLRLELLNSVPKLPKTDPEAYRLFLEIRDAYKNETFTEDLIRSLIGRLKAVIAMDPGYAPAWAMLGNLYARQRGNYLLTAFKGDADAENLAHAALDKALELDPGLSEAYASRAILALTETRLSEMARHLQLALETNPADAYALSLSARLLQYLGRFEEAVPIQDFLGKRDPLNAQLTLAFALQSGYAEQGERAVRYMRRAVDLDPGSHFAPAFLAIVLAVSGNYEEALEDFNDLGANLLTLPGIAYTYQQLGKDTELQGLLDSLPNENPPAMLMARIHGFLGDADKALEWLEQLWRERGRYHGWIEERYLPHYWPIRDDPRWPQFLERLGISNEQLAEIEFEVALPRD